jgi:hypothetical protein
MLDSEKDNNSKKSRSLCWLTVDKFL